MSTSDVRTLTPAALRAWPLPDPDGDKSSRGTVLVVGGARATPGAVLLAGTAAMRAGAGKLQLATVESVTTALGIAVPEAMVIGVPETPRGAVSRELPHALLDVLPRADVLVVGPGLVDVDESEAVLERVLAEAADDVAVVIDAYALAALAH
ncbi:MAG: NAD(P)H-hydrate dehydratase, partial [Hyphomicrobiales bacterium]